MDQRDGYIEMYEFREITIYKYMRCGTFSSNDRILISNVNIIKNDNILGGNDQC